MIPYCRECESYLDLEQCGFTSSNVHIFEYSSTSLARSTEATAFFVAVSYPPISTVAGQPISADLLTNVISTNMMLFLNITRLEILSVAVNGTQSQPIDDFLLLAVIVLPIVVVLVVVILLVGIIVIIIIA